MATFTNLAHIALRSDLGISTHVRHAHAVSDNRATVVVFAAMSVTP